MHDRSVTSLGNDYNHDRPPELYRIVALSVCDICMHFQTEREIGRDGKKMVREK